MARNTNNDGGDDYLQATGITPGISATPCTLACWFYPIGTGNNFLIFVSDNTSSTNHMSLYTISSGRIRCQDYPFTATSATSTVELNQWNHACAVFRAPDDKECYYNGTSVATNVADDSGTPGSFNTIGIGTDSVASPSASDDCHTAEAGLWNTDLSVDEVQALANGDSPELVRPSSLVHYYPLWGVHQDEPDLVGGLHLSFTGSPAEQDHPKNIIYPSTAHAHFAELTAITGSPYHYYAQL